MKQLAGLLLLMLATWSTMAQRPVKLYQIGDLPEDSLKEERGPRLDTATLRSQPRQRDLFVELVFESAVYEPGNWKKAWLSFHAVGARVGPVSSIRRYVRVPKNYVLLAGDVVLYDQYKNALEMVLLEQTAQLTWLPFPQIWLQLKF